MTDKDLLKYAAKAAGYELCYRNKDGAVSIDCIAEWNPLTDDGDALRLAVKLGINLELSNINIYTAQSGGVHCECEGDPYAATRRAIVRAAAEIGKART